MNEGDEITAKGIYSRFESNRIVLENCSITKSN